MKAILLLVAFAIITAPKCHAQGSVSFANTASTRVYTVTPTGTTYVPVGSQFTAELMYAPDGVSTDSAFNAAAVRVGATTTFGPVAGLFSGGGRTVQNMPAGGFGMFQVRVWETAFGSSYEEALGRTCNLGKSAILRVDTGDPTTSPPGEPARLTAYGLTPFVLSAVGGGDPCPEPSTYALGALATATFWLLRRKRRT